MSLRLKTIIGIALIEAVLLAFLIVTTMRYMQASAEEAMLKRAQTTAELFASTAKDPVLSYDLASLESFAKELMGGPDIVYVQVVGMDGTVFTSSGRAPDTALFIEDRNLDAVDDQVFDSSALISEGGVDYAQVRIGFGVDKIEQLLAETRQLSVGIAGVEMLLVALFSWLLGCYLTKQLKVLQRAAGRIEQGDFTRRIKVYGNDEIAGVSRAFNRMSDVLSRSEKQRDIFEAELVDMNKHLEDRVNRRTATINKQYLELKQTHDQLEKTQEQLLSSEKMASLGQLAAGVAHEINNPIGYVHSNLQALQDYVQIYQQMIQRQRDALSAADSERVELLGAVETYESEQDIAWIDQDSVELLNDSIEGTTRVRDIVNGLKDFSSPDNNARVEFGIMECIVKALKVADNELKYKCQVEQKLDSQATIMGNPGQLIQVLINLLVNAAHAIDKDGVVVIESEDRGDSCVVTVSDNGCGISPENLGKLFDPFFTTKQPGQGTGLGLSISYGIIKDHGGDITACSEQGKGTIFKITLPTSESLARAA